MDGQDSAECQNWEYKDIIGINGIFFKSEKDKRGIVSSSSKSKKRENVGRKKRDVGGFRSDFLERERVVLLFRIVGDPTVSGFWDKKESFSTRKGLRMGTRFRDFPQTP